MGWVKEFLRGYIIVFKIVIMCYCGYGDNAIEGTVNSTKLFLCSTFNTTITLRKHGEPYINCQFKLYYTGNISKTCEITKGKLNYSNMGIAIRAKDFNGQLISPTLSCTSNVPIEIKVELGINMGFPHFTNIRRKRILDASQTNLNIIEVRFLKLQIYLQTVNGAVKYQIFTANPLMNKSYIYFEVGQIDEKNCGQTEELFCELQENMCSRSVTLPALLTQNYVHIPIYGFSKLPHYFFREICKYKVDNGGCMGKMVNVPKICLPLDESVFPANRKFYMLKYMGVNYTDTVPFSFVTEVLGIKSDNLLILDMKAKSVEEIEDVAKSFRNSTERPFVVDSRHLLSIHEEVNQFMQMLKTNLVNSCVPNKTFTLDAIQFILQYLKVKEVVFGEAEDVSFIPIVGYQIRSQLLLDFGPGKYYFNHEGCYRYGIHRTHSDFSIDFLPRPDTRIRLTAPKYDIFTGEVKIENVTLACASTYPKKIIDGDNIRSSSRDWLTTFPNSTNFTSTIKKSVRHRYQSYGIVYGLSAQPFLPRSFWRVYQSCNIWSVISDYNYFLGPTRRLQYSQELDLFFLPADQDIKIKHWECKNRFQCQAIVSSCFSVAGHTGQREISSTGMDFRTSCTWSSYDDKIRSCSDVAPYTGSLERFCVTKKASEMGAIEIERVDRTFENDQFIYFRGFDNVMYIDMELKDVPSKNAILKLNITGHEGVLYTHVSYTFECVAHTFYFDDAIRWRLIYKNGTDGEPLREQVKDGDQSSEVFSNAKSELTLILLDTTLKEIICFASYFNRDTWDNVSLPIDIIESTIPVITNQHSNVPFFEDMENQGIRCKAFGHPLPKIVWSRHNTAIEKPLRVIEGNFLHFPLYNSSFSGKYVCNASNILGNATKQFLVADAGKNENDGTLKYTVIGAVVVLIITLFVLFSLYMAKEKIKKYREMKEIIEMLNGNKSSKSDEIDADPTEFLFDTNYDLRRHSFLIDQRLMLGKGEYGEVYRGLLEGTNSTVAFKTVRQNCTMGALRALVSEAKILMYIGPHKYLVTLLGVYRKEIRAGILYVAIEFCEHGSLEAFISKYKTFFLEDMASVSQPTDWKRPISTMPATTTRKQIEDNDHIMSLCTFKSLLMWSEQIACGMEYVGLKKCEQFSLIKNCFHCTFNHHLFNAGTKNGYRVHNTKVIHSDLATRNVLLTTEGTAKVTDFGLSRRTYDYSSEYIKTGKEPLPWRWLAVESLKNNTFSAQSDVWAYGITLWEIFSLGDTPYPGMAFTMEFVQELENGLKNFKPKYASDEIYYIMEKCWDLEPKNRPSFSSMKKIFNYALSNGLTSLSDEISEYAHLDDVATKLSLSDYLEM